MATNEVIDEGDIWQLDGDELAKHLLEQGFSDDTISILKGMHFMLNYLIIKTSVSKKKY